MRPVGGKPVALLKTMVSASAVIAPLRVSAPVRNVTSPADVVARIGVMS